MPVSEDVNREMLSLFEEAISRSQASVDLTPLLLLQRLENLGGVWDLEEFGGHLAVCRSVMLTTLDVTHGDRILVEHREALVIRFVLPRPGLSLPPED